MPVLRVILPQADDLGMPSELECTDVRRCNLISYNVTTHHFLAWNAADLKASHIIRDHMPSQCVHYLGPETCWSLL